MINKFLKSFSYISGLIILFLPILFLSLHKIFLVDLTMLKNIILLNPLWLTLLDLSVKVAYVYLIILFFIKFVRIYREGNSFAFYLNHFIVSSLLFLAVFNLIGLLFILQNEYETPFFVVPVFVIANLLLVICLRSFNKTKGRFSLSKQKRSVFLKLMLVSVSFSFLAYLVSSLLGQYLFIVPIFILLSFLSCLFVLPFFRMWKEAIDDEKYNKVKVFFSTQIIITSLVTVIINAVYSALLLFRIIN